MAGRKGLLWITMPLKIVAHSTFLLKLTHLCVTGFPTLINWTSPFPFYELLDGVSFSILYKFYKNPL